MMPLHLAKILGLVLMPYSVSMLTPLVVAHHYHEASVVLFLTAAAINFGLGALLYLPGRKITRELRARDGFLVVTLIWVVLCGVSGLPFWLATAPHCTWIDALFEAVSGLTTTGVTIYPNVDELSRSLLYYRQQLQFIGGGGIVLLGVAVLPMLGIGGMQLLRAEMPGPFKDDKLTPRITQTAKALWFIYCGLVVACALSYKVAGMTWFDAIGNSFGTISTGGFSTHPDSFAHYSGASIKLLGALFMFLGAANFSLHYVALRVRNVKHYKDDLETLFYIGVILFAALFAVVGLHYSQSVRLEKPMLWVDALFQSVTFVSTTGLVSANYAEWPLYITMMLAFVSLVGGCAGSTAGGLKMIRMIFICQQGVREIKRLVHPNGFYVIKLGNLKLPEKTLEAIWGFFGIFIVTFVILLIALLATGMDLVSAFSSLATTISGTGAALGSVSSHFKHTSDVAKVILSFAMLIGRLEFFTIIVLFTRYYWLE